MGDTEAVLPSGSPVGGISQQVLATDISSQLSSLPPHPAGISGGSTLGCACRGDLWFLLRAAVCALCHPGALSTDHSAACLPCPPIPPGQQQCKARDKDSHSLEITPPCSNGLTPGTIPVFGHSQESTEPVCPWLTTSSGSA